MNVRKLPVTATWSMIAAAAASIGLLGASPASASVTNGLHADTAGASASQNSAMTVRNAREVSYTGRIATGVSAASTTDGFEWATKGTPPSDLSGCTSGYEVEICFQKYGDKIWVKNNSITNAQWGHYSNWLRDNNSNWKFWRNGDCGVDFIGWGYCDKDFYEDSTKNAKGGYGSGVRLYPCDGDYGCTSYYGWVRNNA